MTDGPSTGSATRAGTRGAARWLICLVIGSIAVLLPGCTRSATGAPAAPSPVKYSVVSSAPSTQPDCTLCMAPGASKAPDASADLLTAAGTGDGAGVTRALGAGASADAADDQGRTALIRAVALGDGSTTYQDVVTQLLTAGASRTVADKAGLTALQHAEAKGYAPIVALLRAA
ncbi:MAG TPA: hypothetical protein PKM36_07915 [Propionibacteriaceae bacterium]|nr:hypothetical protein [Propionibacteriaceae bacterium]HPZ49777.1 hypothetical protein [Propionibacteriaceae bacterium]HQE32087.1 hypothetical protein [Propionibacteriaceae bacterium]